MTVTDGRATQDQVWFLAHMDRVNRVLQTEHELRDVLTGVLSVVLDALACDRAWLLYPCDPEAATWRVPIEVTKPEWPGAHAIEAEVPMDDEVRAVMRGLLDRDAPVAFGPDYEVGIPADVRAQFGVQTQLAMPLRPRLGSAWMFGIHQCSHARRWTDPELVLFREIGRRLADGVSTLLAFQDLRESEARLRLFRTLIDSTHDAIQVLDAQGRFLDVNEDACAALGYTRDEYLGLHVSDIDPDWNQENWSLWMVRMRDGAPPRVFEGRHRRKDGSVFPVEVNATYMHIDRDYIVAIVRDITDRKQAELEMRQLEDQLRQSQKMEAIGQLAGGVAHDFNNLLLVINFNSELIADSLDPSDPMRRAVGEIRDAGDRAATLTRQLLAFSRKQVLHPQVVDINVVLRELLTMLERLIGEDVQVSLLTQEQRALARIDPGQFSQAIVNLGVNARDAMPAGGALTIAASTIEIEADAEGDAAGRYVLVTVSDSGVGMDDATSGRIFEPFFTTKEAGRGTGLGLAMVYGFVTQSGGHVDVRSRPGEGTTFSLYLPASEADAPDRLPSQAAERPERGTETVLVAEDADGVRSLVRDMLTARGYTVLEARDGEAALDLARAYDGRIDLLVADVVMPGISGPDLAARLEADHPDLRCLLMSGYTGEALSRYGDEVPGRALLQKPFDPATLLRSVRDVLDA